VLAEFLSAALNQQAMLWRTSPAATELEEVAMNWLRGLMGLPAAFEGVIYDTASIATLHALAAAREAAVPGVRELGLVDRRGLGGVRVYCSEHAHSSVDKAMIMLGLGQASLRRIAADAEFRMRPDALREAIDRDRAHGVRPIAVVATVGTTSTTSVDPVGDVAAICRAEDVWLHVDAAYAASTCSQIPSRSQIAATASTGSTLVADVVPTVATTASGAQPDARSSAIARSSASARMRNSPSHEIRLMDSSPRPSMIIALSTDECA